MKKLIILLSPLFVLGCVRKADIKLPPAEKKPVVTCFISPQDSVITAVVAWSTPKLGLNGSSTTVTAGAVKDATLSIYSPLGQKTFSLNPDFLYYECTGISIAEGGTYTLNVLMPGGKQITATTSVPLKKPRVSSLTRRITHNETKRLEVEVDLVVEDFKNEINYFALFTRQMSMPLRPDSPFGTMGAYDTDEKISKQEYLFSTGASYYNNTDTITGAWLYLDVLHCNREFYLYNKSVQEAGIASFNPFADPAMVFSNIPGGFGCFGAYLREEKNLQLR